MLNIPVSLNNLVRLDKLTRGLLCDDVWVSNVTISGQEELRSNSNIAHYLR